MFAQKNQERQGNCNCCAQVPLEEAASQLSIPFPPPLTLIGRCRVYVVFQHDESDSANLRQCDRVVESTGLILPPNRVLIYPYFLGVFILPLMVGNYSFTPNRVLFYPNLGVTGQGPQLGVTRRCLDFGVVRGARRRKFHQATEMIIR